jgi:hypothetical protein
MVRKGHGEKYKGIWEKNIIKLEQQLYSSSKIQATILTLIWNLL